MKVIFVLAVFVALANATSLDWRITGLGIAEEGQFPYQAYIKAVVGSSCNGCILNKRWILTAGDCVYLRQPSMLSVVVGSNHLLEAGDDYEVESSFTHEDYNYDTKEYNIGLVKVASDIQFSKNIQPIAINREEIGGGEELVVSGWGSMDLPQSESYKLHFVKSLSITYKECDARHKPIFGHGIDTTIMCTVPKVGQGVVFAYPGGPLAYNGTVAGIVTSTLPTNQCYINMYTKVSDYADWIEAHMD